MRMSFPQAEIARLQAEIAAASLHGALTSTVSGGLPQIPLSVHAGSCAALPRPRPPAAATAVAAPVACIVTTAIDHHVEPAAVREVTAQGAATISPRIDYR